MLSYGARRFPTREVKTALIAAAIAAPSVLYMLWLYKAEPIFKARADTATLSPNPALYLLGYGLLIPLAIYGLRILWRKAAAGTFTGQEHQPPAAGGTLRRAQRLGAGGSIPVTWVAVYSEHIGNTFEPKGFSIGSTRPASSSK